MDETVRLSILAPAVLRHDRNGRAFLAALDTQMRELQEALPLGQIRRDINTMSEELLDEMAWERFVSWYDDTADVETKRALIRDSRLIHSRMGTPWAVHRVVLEYFSDGWVMEWNEYGGEPYHFSVGVLDQDASQAKSALLRRVVERVKNVRSVFDGVFIVMDSFWTGYYGACVDEGEILELREE